jgi:cbb3-type cytochrome c oxidase subunit III
MRMQMNEARTRGWIGWLAAWAMLAASPAGWAGVKDSTNTVRHPDAIYHNYCSVCHGDRGDGHSRARNSLVPPPRDFTTPEAREQLTRERMIDSVTNGRPGTAMVGWKTQLGPEEVAAVVDYIRTTFMRSEDSGKIERGGKIYAHTCASCHGDRGQGAVPAGSTHKPPRDLTSPQAATELDRARMIAAVAHGKPGTPMSAYAGKLSNADIEAVVDFVRARIMMPSIANISGVHAHELHRPVVATSTDLAAPMPKGLHGNKAAGRTFYLGNCATCHGARGDGAGPRAYFQNPKPRNFLQSEWKQSYSRPFLFAAISAGKVGTEMPAWSKVLTDQQIADVAEFVFEEFIAQAPVKP